MTYFNRIEINPKIMMGKPVVKGARIPVYIILNLLAEGCTERAIRKDYPDITRDDIAAVLRFAASMTQFEETRGKLPSAKVKIAL